MSHSSYLLPLPDFHMFSAVGPLLLDVLSFVRRSNNEEGYQAPPGFEETAKLAPSGKENIPSVLLGASRDAEVPDRYISMICHLLLTNSWPSDIDDEEQEVESQNVARYIASIFMKCTTSLDLIVWAVDDIPHADAMSWSVIELLYTHSCNLMMLMASRRVEGADMNVNLEFWDDLHAQNSSASENFLRVECAALGQRDLNLLVEKMAEKQEPKWEGNIRELSKEVFVQSGGIPRLAVQILERKLSHSAGKSAVRSEKKKKKSKKKRDSLTGLGLRGLTRQNSWNSCSSSVVSTATDNMADVGEHMLHKVDMLSSDARTYLNLGALLGPTFDTRDVISVMERYRCIPDSKKETHTDAIRNCLEEAVQCGIIEDDFAEHEASFCFNDDDNDDVSYKFTHVNWRKILLKTVLNSWKRDMLRLVAESMEATFFSHDSDDHNGAIKRLFAQFKGGKKAGKNLLVASELALKIGDKMAKDGLWKFSKKIYEKALELWLKPQKEDAFLMMFEGKQNEMQSSQPFLVLKFSNSSRKLMLLFKLPADEISKPRNSVDFEPEEYEYIAMLYNALGRSHFMLLDRDESFEAYQKCIDVRLVRLCLVPCCFLCQFL